MIDPSGFPIIYRHKAVTAYVVYPLLLLVILGGAATLLAAGIPHQHWGLTLLGALFGIGGVANFLQLLICKLALYPDRIEWVSLWGNNTLQLSDIKGRGRPVGRRDAIAALYPKDPTQKALFLPGYFKYDEGFKRWLERLPNLDPAPNQPLEDLVAGDDRYGATPEDKRAKIAGLKRTTKFINWGSIVLAVWTLVYPHPFDLVFGLSLLAPWLAIAMVALSKGLYSLLESDKVQLKLHGDLFALMYLPVYAFMLLGARHDIGFPEMPLHWQPLVLPALLVGAVMVALIAKASKLPGLPLRRLAVVFAFLTLYAGLSTGLLNSEFDTHQPKIYALTVTGKTETRHRRGTSYWLQIVNRSGSDYAGPTQLLVNSHLYNQVAPEQVVCTHLYPGALGLAWEDTTLCGG